MTKPRKKADPGPSDAATPAIPTVDSASAPEGGAAPADTVEGGDGLDAERRRLAERLRETREFLGLSQQDAAAAAGLTRLVVSSIETGRRKVESVELHALAGVYGQPVTYFLPASDVEPAPEEVQFIARAARELAPEDRVELLRFAEFLKSYKAPRGGRGAAPEG